MAPRWLDGLADVLATTEAPCYVVSEALAEEVTGFHVHRGAPLPRAATAAAPRRRTRRRPVGAGARGDRRPHERGCHLPLRRRARLRRCPAGAALRRPALPAVDQGGDGRGVRAAVDAAAGLVRRPSVAVLPWLHHGGADAGRGRRTGRGRGR